MKAIEMRISGSIFVTASILCVIVIFFTSASGQSTVIDYPTPVYANEITGLIRARDIGDPRLTSHFYTFLGGQGDVFLNVVTKNFSGDIDVFLADGLKPLTKIVVYAETAESETGRVVYLRKPEKLILRIEGRSPNDDPATYRIKFAGSFEASKDPIPQEPDLPKVDAVAEGNVRVNSVGTIVAVVPKPKPTPKASEAAAEAIEEKTEEVVKIPPKEEPGERVAEPEGRKTEVVVTENIPEGTRVETKRPPVARSRGRRPAAKKITPPETTEVAAAPEGEKPAEPKPAARSTRTKAKNPPKSSEPDPLANIHLVIEFKDGSRIERPMSEVIRFSVDRGILTVVSKDGTIGRYAIVDVARTTIQ